MSILIITEKKIPEFIESFLNKNNVGFFKARGSIKCQSILVEQKIKYIFFFYSSAMNKIKKDIFKIINLYSTPVILFLESFDKTNSINKDQIKNYLSEIVLLDDKTAILNEINYIFNGFTKNVEVKKTQTNNYIFRNLLNRISKKENLEPNSNADPLPLSSDLKVSVNEKEALLKNFDKISKKKIKDIF